MPVEFAGDSRTTDAITRARALHESETATHHLLTGLAAGSSPAAEVLDAFDLTQAVTITAVRDGDWAAPDGVDRVETEVAVEGRALTGGANAALARYLEQPEPRGPETLLANLLRDDSSHAARLVRECGVDVGELRRAAIAGQRPARVDRVAPELRPARDVLLGRGRYPGGGLRNLSLSIAVRLKPNYAAQPTLWAKLEADQIAKRRGGRARTDDVLVAMLATYEVAGAYPHLSRGVPELWDGVRALAETGVDHHRAAAVAEAHDLGGDVVPPKSLIAYGENFPKSTGELLTLLRAHDGNRSARLLSLLATR